MELLGHPERYGTCLLEVAARCARRPQLSLSASMARRPRVAARIERIVALAGNVSPRVGRWAGGSFMVALTVASCLLAASGGELAADSGDRSDAAPLRPAAEQAEGMTVDNDGSVRYTQGRFEVSLRPVTAEEFSRQFLAQAQETYKGNTLFRLMVRNYEYPKVYIDPASIVLRPHNDREYRSLAYQQLDHSDPLWQVRMGVLPDAHTYRTMYIYHKGTACSRTRAHTMHSPMQYANARGPSLQHC